MNEHFNEDICLDLLRGFLSAEETDRALEHAATCAACERLFVQAAAREERVRTRGALRVQPDGQITLEPYIQAKQAAAQEDSNAIQTAGISWRHFLRPAVAVAAVAAVAVALFMVWPIGLQDPAQELLRPMAAPGEEVYLRGGQHTRENDDLQEGIEAYSSGNLRAAADLLESAETTGQLDNLRRVYLGSAYARLGEYENAVTTLEAVHFMSVPDPWGGEGQWTLYVSLKALDRNEEAQSILGELAREPGEFGDRAREALGSD